MTVWLRGWDHVFEVTYYVNAARDVLVYEDSHKGWYWRLLYSLSPIPTNFGPFATFEAAMASFEKVKDSS